MTKTEELYELFVVTLSRLDDDRLCLNDDELATEIFEDLDSEYHSYLHELTVDILIKDGLIPNHLKDRILALRENIRPIMEEKHEIQFYRNDLDWKKLRKESKSIMNEIKTANCKTKKSTLLD